MSPQTLYRLTQQDHAHYANHGFLLLKKVVPDETLVTGQSLLEPWVEYFVTEWKKAGLLTEDFSPLDFWHRFYAAWKRAGRPHYRRMPNRFLINPQMYAFLTRPVFLDIAEQVLHTSDISMHGIFNGRPQLPEADFAQTPWHQDSQYWSLDYGQEPDSKRETHVITMWMPLQAVDSTSGCLAVMSRQDIGDKVFEPFDYDYKKTGFLGLSPQEIARYPQIPVTMDRGDLLIFNQKTPHAAMKNVSDHIRWSIDIRYEATETATVVGRKFGFVARSERDPSSVTPVAEWCLKQQR